MSVKDDIINEFSQCVDLESSKEDILKKVNELKELEFKPEQYSIMPRLLGGNNCQDFVGAVTGQGDL